VALPEGRSAASAELIRPDDDGHPRETIIPAVEGREAVFPMFTPRVYGLARVTFRA
jgi:hypothetical protein